MTKSYHKILIDLVMIGRDVQAFLPSVSTSGPRTKYITILASQAFTKYIIYFVSFVS